MNSAAVLDLKGALDQAYRGPPWMIFVDALDVLVDLKLLGRGHRVDMDLEHDVPVEASVAGQSMSELPGSWDGDHTQGHGPATQ